MCVQITEKKCALLTRVLLRITDCMTLKTTLLVEHDYPYIAIKQILNIVRRQYFANVSIKEVTFKTNCKKQLS